MPVVQCALHFLLHLQFARTLYSGIVTGAKVDGGGPFRNGMLLEIVLTLIIASFTVKTSDVLPTILLIIML